MQFQTIFYIKATGRILHVENNKYIKSKQEKLRFCPGHKHEEVNFLYFQADTPVEKGVHSVRFVDACTPPQVVNDRGVSLVYEAIKSPFLKQINQFSDLILDFCDSVGDKLYRANAVIEAQKVYPSLRFFCQVEPAHREIMELIPEITLFQGYREHGLTPKECGLVKMPAAFYVNPKDLFMPAPSGYGLYLGLDQVPYTVKLDIPPDFDARFAGFDEKHGVRPDGNNIVIQARTKGDEGRSWDNPKVIDLARLVNNSRECKIFVLGSATDFLDDAPGLTNLSGATSWLETIHLLRQASHVFCIDSAVLHLCHAMDIPCFRLWGRTNPRSVLGEPETDMDIFSGAPGAPSNIKAISPLQVYERAFPEERAKLEYPFDSNRDYSEHGDQQIIFQYFNDHTPVYKHLVDVGAFGKQLSNSFGLLEMGWKGLLIEASPERFKTVQREFKGFDVTCLNIGISDRPQKSPFHLHTVPGHDSFVADWYPPTATDQAILIQQKALHVVLQENNIPLDFDFLSIDTEGMDEKIMKKFFNASEYRPRLIVTEWNAPNDASGLFHKFGYEQIGKTGAAGFENLFFARRAL